MILISVMGNLMKRICKFDLFLNFSIFNIFNPLIFFPLFDISFLVGHNTLHVVAKKSEFLF